MSRNGSRFNEVLGLIPARGGSKGIPKKNLVRVAGKPLLAHTCEQARRAKTLTRVVLSTDDAAIARCARACGVEVPFLRPARLAADRTPMIDVVRHALEMLRRREGYDPKIVVLLQPTSPLRRADQIDAAVKQLLATGADSVVSVVEVPHQFRPGSLMRLDGERLVPVQRGRLVLRRQDKPKVFARNGPAVLAVRAETVRRQGTLYGAHCRALVMDADSSLDVDSPPDLAHAEYLLTHRLMRC